jgi:hypothetical protein
MPLCPPQAPHELTWVHTALSVSYITADELRRQVVKIHKYRKPKSAFDVSHVMARQAVSQIGDLPLYL